MRAPVLITYFALTYAVTWGCWFAAVGVLGRAAPATPAALLGRILLLVGVFTPGLMGLAFSLKRGGRAAALALLRPILRWEVAPRWYVFAVGYMVALKLAAALLDRLASGTWPRFGDEPVSLMAAALVLSTWPQAGEEVGWRGYALPQLWARIGLGPASVVLGVIWACWHLPLFFIGGGDTVRQSFPLYLLQVTAFSVALAWLFWRTNASLLLVMLLHAAVNNTKDVVPSAVPGASSVWTLHASPIAWITVTLLSICAGYFLWRMRGADLTGHQAAALIPVDASGAADRSVPHGMGA